MGEGAYKIEVSEAVVHWFLASGDKLRGPFKLDEIKNLLRSGHASPNEFCWRPGFSEWRPLFSIQELEAPYERKQLRLQAMVSFPTVEAPGKTVRYRAEEDPSNHEARKNWKERRPKKVVVTLNRSKKRLMSVYEWALAVMLMLLFGFVSVKLAISEVESRLDQKLALRFLGQPKKLPSQNRANGAISPFAFEPLLSAPGLNLSDSVYEPRAPMANLKVEANIDLLNKSIRFSVDELQADWQMGFYSTENTLPLWSPQSVALDQIYQRRNRLDGQIKWQASENNIGFHFLPQGSAYIK